MMNKKEVVVVLQELYEECVNLLSSVGYETNVSNITLNNRLSSTYGSYCEDDFSIEINEKVFNLASKDQNMTTIIHELSHNIDHMLNGSIDSYLEGHGENWVKIANNISEKLRFQIQRYTPFTIQIHYDKKYHHTYKCEDCGAEKMVMSKYKDESKVRRGRCKYCNSDIKYLFNGQYAISMKNGERTIQLDNY